MLKTRSTPKTTKRYQKPRKTTQGSQMFRYKDNSCQYPNAWDKIERTNHTITTQPQ